MGNEEIEPAQTPFERKDVEDVFVSGVGEGEDKNVDVHTGLREWALADKTCCADAR